MLKNKSWSSKKPTLKVMYVLKTTELSGHLQSHEKFVCQEYIIKVSLVSLVNLGIEGVTTYVRMHAGMTELPFILYLHFIKLSGVENFSRDDGVLSGFFVKSLDVCFVSFI